MEPKSILLISYYFPPMNMVAALRVYSFARHLAGQGFKVTVLCSSSRSMVNSPDDFDCTPFNIVEIVHKGAGKNIDYYYQQALLSGSGFKRVIWKVKDTIIRFVARIKNRVVGNLLMPEDAWWLAASREAARLDAAVRFSAVITSSGPISCHFIGFNLKKGRSDIAWIADYRDPWLDNPNWIRPLWPARKTQAVLQKRLNDVADALVTVSPQLLEDFFPEYAAKAVVIENGYFPEDVPGEHVPAAGKMIMTYTGTFYDTTHRCMEFFEGVRKSIDRGVIDCKTIEIRIFGSNVDSLSRMAGRYGLNDLVTIYPKVSRAESLALQRGSNALLVFSSMDSRYRGFYGAKLFEYIVSGAPIIMVGNLADSFAAQLVMQSGTGFVCGGDSEKVVEAVAHIAGNNLPTRNEEFISSFRRDRLAARLGNLVGQLLDRQRAS